MRNRDWNIRPEGMPQIERSARTEGRAASIATSMMLALMPAFGIPPRIRVTRETCE